MFTSQSVSRSEYACTEWRFTPGHAARRCSYQQTSCRLQKPRRTSFQQFQVCLDPFQTLLLWRIPGLPWLDGTNPQYPLITHAGIATKGGNIIEAAFLLTRTVSADYAISGRGVMAMKFTWPVEWRDVRSLDVASDERVVVCLLVGAGVRREIDFEVRQLQGFEDVLTVLVSFDRDALDVDPGRGSVTMPERVLGLT
jgi:hypothetical protein